MSLRGTFVSFSIGRQLSKLTSNCKFFVMAPTLRPVSSLNTVPQWVFDKQQKSYYSSLPKLPLPPLKQTLQRFLFVSKALLSRQDYEITLKMVEEFGKVGGEGEKLHSLLEQRAQKLDNWLSDWWLQYGYMEQRCPLPINVSPGLMFPNQKYVGLSGQTEFTSRLMVAIIKYKELIDSGQLKLDTASKMPLDMSQYDLLFGTTRIPGVEKDSLRYGVNESQPARHAVVVFRNRFFQVPVYDNDGHPLSAHQLIRVLNDIVENFSSDSKADAVGLLTTEERDVWARNYAKLRRNPKNARALDVIERGLFVVCLDQQFSYGSSAESAFASQLLHGDGSKVNGGNRWFDKCLQFIVAPDGYCGMTYEHSPAEGPPIAALMDYAIDFVSKPDSTTDDSEKALNFEVLNFDLDNDDRLAIKRAAEKFDKISSDIEMEILRFKHFGKQFGKTQRVSPDSVVQLALQLTFFKMHKECPSTYETGTLRRFHLGRTDTIRLPTMESSNFCRNAVNSQNSDVQKAELFRRAVQSHKEYTAAACSGNGIDRHLLGLKLIALDNGWAVPKFYESKAYETALHFKLSTSQVAAKHDSCMMFGPMYPDCYGVCYNPQNNQINISVTAFKSFPGTSASKFAKTLEESLLEIRDFLSKGTKSKL